MMDNSAPEKAPSGAQVIQTNRIMTVAEQMALERRQAGETDYYAVYLEHEVTGEMIRVRTVVWELDEDRNPILDANGNRKARNPHDVGLDVWGAHGADEYALKTVMLAARVLATPETIAENLALGQAARAA